MRPEMKMSRLPSRQVRQQWQGPSMPESEDERKGVIEPTRPTDHHAVIFGVQLLRIVAAILLAFVVLHFIIKYW